MTALLQASCQGYHQIMVYLIEHGADVNVIGDVGFNCQLSPLHLACSYGFLDVVKLLIEHGADLNIKTNTGLPPIGFSNNTSDIVGCLIDNGADVNVKWNNPILGKPILVYTLIANFRDPYYQQIDERVNTERSEIRILIENGMI